MGSNVKSSDYDILLDTVKKNENLNNEQKNKMLGVLVEYEKALSRSKEKLAVVIL